MRVDLWQNSIAWKGKNLVKSVMTQDKADGEKVWGYIYDKIQLFENEMKLVKSDM